MAEVGRKVVVSERREIKEQGGKDAEKGNLQ